MCTSSSKSFDNFECIVTAIAEARKIEGSTKILFENLMNTRILWLTIFQSFENLNKNLLTSIVWRDAWKE